MSKPSTFNIDEFRWAVHGSLGFSVSPSATDSEYGLAVAKLAHAHFAALKEIERLKAELAKASSRATPTVMSDEDLEDLLGLIKHSHLVAVFPSAEIILRRIVNLIEKSKAELAASATPAKLAGLSDEELAVWHGEIDRQEFNGELSEPVAEHIRRIVDLLGKCKA